MIGCREPAARKDAPFCNFGRGGSESGCERCKRRRRHRTTPLRDGTGALQLQLLATSCISLQDGQCAGGPKQQQQQQLENRRSFYERPLPLMPCRPRLSPTSGKAAKSAVRLDPSARPTLQARRRILAAAAARLPSCAAAVSLA
ncbi:uncharacterized protein PSANT_06273 [Moesziomyces antarcticus]|uniref:Uncharacterized protein n=1 Tax=Pseudozyma antarctica TaxID=84753 RepID=A0A5C3FW96_PSEA2|nr:uncharacterized protein PSANT_06273 [Moesziomyces antarcticus]